MNPLFLYLLKASISLTIFYGFYILIYKREAFFNFNRAFLMFALLIAMALPFFNFNIFSFAGNEVQSPENMLYYAQLPVFQLNEFIANGESSVTESISFISLITYIYFAVVLFKSFQFLFRLNQISIMSSRNKSIYKDGVQFVFISKDLPIFSFFNRIFINEDTFNKQDAEKIIEHEKIHIKQFHSIDLLLAEVVCIFQWFNPFAYLLKKEMKENHEFVVDRSMIFNKSEDDYRILLMEYTTSIKTNILVHNFSYSLLKRRLQMMKKRKSITRFAFNLFWIMPVLLLVLFACSSPNQEPSVQGDEVLTNKNLQNNVYKKVSVTTFTREGGIAIFLIKLGYERHIKFDVLHEDGTRTTLLDGIQVPDTAGALICNDKEKVLFKNGHYTYNLKADHDKIIHGSFDIPVNIEKMVSNESNGIFQVVEQQPEFPGGMSKLYSYLGESIKYPEQAKSDSIAGKVYVTFVVEKDGSISNVKILRGIGGGCDKEAMRVISEMPKWNPGLMDEQPVRVQFNLPIKFALE